MADGDYSIVVECTDGWDRSMMTAVAFTKGPQRAEVMRAESDGVGPIAMAHSPPTDAPCAPGP